MDEKLLKALETGGRLREIEQGKKIEISRGSGLKIKRNVHTNTKKATRLRYNGAFCVLAIRAESTQLENVLVRDFGIKVGWKTFKGGKICSPSPKKTIQKAKLTKN